MFGVTRVITVTLFCLSGLCMGQDMMNLPDVDFQKMTPRGRKPDLYQYMFFEVLRTGWDAKSIIDVGSSNPPFISNMFWIPQKTILGPFFRSYDGGKYANEDEKHFKAGGGIKTIAIDFMDWDFEQSGKSKYDVAICMQTIEHVPDPGAFIEKLCSIAKTVIVSLPYRWDDFDKREHIHHHITMKMVWNWIRGRRVHFLKFFSVLHPVNYEKGNLILHFGDFVRH